MLSEIQERPPLMRRNVDGGSHAPMGSRYSALHPVITDNPWSTHGAWVIQCDTTQVMVMDLFRVVRHPGP
jgi:hypothetical protein